MTFTACEKDAADLFSTDPVAPVMNGSTTQVQLTEAMMGEQVTLAWTPARNVQGEISYTLHGVYGETDAVMATTNGVSYTVAKSALLDALKSHFTTIPEREHFSVDFYVAATAGELTINSEKLAVKFFVNPTDEAPVLTATAEKVELSGTKMGDQIELLKWTPAFAGIGGEVSYTLYATIGDTEFALAEDLKTTSFSQNHAAWNDLLKNNGVAAGDAADVTFMVEAETPTAKLVSNTVKVNIQTYTFTPKVAVWGLIGQVNGTTWDVDAQMKAIDNGLWISEVVTVEGEFKIRWDMGWDTNRGGSFVALGEPFAVTPGGSNIAGVPAGSYYVVYNEIDETVTVYGVNQGWGMIGDALPKGWDSDSYFAAEVAPGIFQTGAVTFANNGGFKFRKNADWGVNFGGDFVAYGTEFDAVADGNNISATAGEAYLTLDTNAKKIVVDNNRFRNRWGIIGQVSGYSWDIDVWMYESEGKWISSPFRVDGEFKIRYNAGWDVNRGGSFSALGTAFDVTAGGSNIAVPDMVGKYVKLVYDPATEQITITEFK